MIDAVKRVRLGNLPTPLEEAPRLGRHLGLSKLLIKRDDLTGLSLGGNKVRKLEYELAEVIEEGCDVVLTVGGPQSNHARITAAAARKLGLDVKLVLGGPSFAECQGNLLLDGLLGAEIRYLNGNDSNEDLAAAVDGWARELEAQGHKPHVIPLGGSTALGALGYVRAMQELSVQMGSTEAEVVMAVGSCGTLAGVCLGARLFMPMARVIGISVSRSSTEITTRTLRLIEESTKLLGTSLDFSAKDIESYDQYFEEYGVLTESGKDAILTSARLEGMLLDPVYTGKAMAGLMDLARNGRLTPNIPTVFLHTGGQPILFAFGAEFRGTSSITNF